MPHGTFVVDVDGDAVDDAVVVVNIVVVSVACNISFNVTPSKERERDKEGG